MVPRKGTLAKLAPCARVDAFGVTLDTLPEAGRPPEEDDTHGGVKTRNTGSAAGAPPVYMWSGGVGVPTSTTLQFTPGRMFSDERS